MAGEKEARKRKAKKNFADVKNLISGVLISQKIIAPNVKIKAKTSSVLQVDIYISYNSRGN